MVAQIESERLVETANQLVARFVDRTPHFEMFMELNEALLNVTQSEYGFVARVYRNEKGPFIKTVALSNIAWNEETQKLYAENAEKGMVFANLDTLFGEVLKTGKIYIAEDASNDPKAAGIPSGHPRLDRFAGIPVLRKGILIGMIGLANGVGYCEQMVDELRPLLDITSHILHATGLQEQLIPDGNYFRQPLAILNSFKSGIISIDDSGKIISTNPSAAMIFGYASDEIIGQRIQSLIPPSGSNELYSAENALDLRPHLFGRSFETTGVSKIESYFPVEVTVDEVVQSDPKQFALVIRNITEEKKRERFKNEFISMISHELRTPLTAVHLSLSMLDSIEHRPTQQQELDEMVAIATRNCERLVNLVDEILDYEKLNLDEIEFCFHPVDLKTVIQTVKETTKILADQSEIELAFTLANEDIFLAADANRLSQVLINLITNAIRVSKPGATVHIGFNRINSNQIRLSVTDSGPGISPDDITHIFEPFKQTQKNASGAGLGLAICKRILDSHDTSLECISQLGHGSTFQFDLFEYCKLNPSIEIKSRDSQQHVLWVEGNKPHFEFTHDAIQLPEVRYHRKANCQLAKEFLNHHEVDLIVVEFPFALENCDSFFQQIRTCEAFREIPIVLYSNSIPQDLKISLDDLNVVHDIKKSWNHENLKNRIRSLLGKED